MQRINNGINNYGLLLRNRPPVNVQPPAGIDIGMLEICVFFPSWFLLPDVAMRSVLNGWSRRDVAKAQLYATNQLTKANLLTAENRIQKQISEGGKLWCNLDKGDRWERDKMRERYGLYHDLRADTWKLRCSFDPNQKQVEFGHFRLADIHRSVPVVNWPTGADRLLLTKCFEYDARYPQLDLGTEDIEEIIQRQGLIPTNFDAQHDIDTLDHVDNIPDPVY